MEQPPQIKTKNIDQIKNIFDFVKKQTWFFAALIALLSFIALRKFIFDIRKVNNMDMQETFYKGDVLLLKKFSNTFSTNDIIYIEFPGKDSTQPTTYFFQRLIGLPGDSIEIIDKVVYINGMAIEDTSSLKHNYHIKTVNMKMDSVNKKLYNLPEGSPISEKNDYSFSITKYKADSLKRLSEIEVVELEMEPKGSSDLSCFPGSVNYKWNMDNYGALYIPKKDDIIRLDTTNIVLYKKLIQLYEKNTLLIKGDSIFINDVLSRTYTVKRDYYFMLGDNRDNANDSRKWGFLPDNYIVGKSIRLIKKVKQ
ncbi:MAG: signal peptidase I [Bacteroidia bacterium]